MKLVRFGPPGAERPGLLLDEGLLDIRASAFDIEDFTPHFFRHGGPRRLAALLEDPGCRILPREGVRLGAPLPRPGKIICVGKNYVEHIREFGGGEPPKVPVLFAKAPTALNGPFDPVVLPPEATIVDGEAELAVVIGRTASRVPEKRAMEHVFGYTLLNDVTDREAQRAGGQWFRGKGCDTFCPLGPWVASRDEIADPHALRVRQRVNGVTLQDGHTGDMLFTIPQLIAFISAAMTLEPGDVIATGTPSGIGSARTPPVLLRPGDVMECELDGLGLQRNPVVALPG